MARVTSVLLLAFVAGCAGLSEADCRSADWYVLGYNDARAHIRPQSPILDQQCQRYGLKIDPARYQQGWRAGADEYVSP